MSGEEKAPLNILWHGSGDNSLQPNRHLLCDGGYGVAVL